MSLLRGDSYVASTERLEVRRCELDSRDCEHWLAV